VTVQIPYFGSTGTIEYLQFLAKSTPKIEKEWTGKTPTYRAVVFEFLHECQATTFVSSLNETFHPNFLSHALRDVPMFKSSWQLLEEMVKAHDVHHEMSDDHRVWQSGQAELRAIKDLANKLAIIDKERVRGMVKGIFKITV
jgi:hypothetical protein